MKKSFLFLLAISSFSFLFLEANAQINTPASSPFCKMTQTVGLTDVTVEYSRPSVKDRTIFAANDALVPYGKKWRTGANAATKITFSNDVKVNGTELKKGSYAVITTPNANSWTMEFHSYESGNWGSYAEKTPAATVTAKVTTLPVAIETFLITMDNLRNHSATLDFLWDKTLATVEIQTNDDEKVLANIDKVLAGPSSNDYYNAASYYYTSGKDLNKALNWVQKATHVEEPRFWQVRRESQILAALKRYPEAITAAKKSMELAKAAGNDDYVRLNEKAISEWTKM